MRSALSSGGAAEEDEVKHDKQCGSGSPLFNWLCIGACAAPAVTLVLFYPDSRWLSAALMLAVCGGMHFLMTRSTAAGDANVVQRPEEGIPAPQTTIPATDSGVVGANEAPLPDRQTRDAA